MPEENNNNGGGGDATKKTPLTLDSEDPNNDAPTGDDDEGGEDEDKEEEFTWGFGDIFKEDAPEEEAPAERKPAEGDNKPTDVDILKQEVSQLREQARIRQEFELLESKYAGKEGFPEVDKKQVMNFLQNDFGKMSPMEFGYILSNFGNIVKAARESGRGEVETQYSPEVTAQRAQVERQTAMSERMAQIGENLKRQYGISKEDK